MLRGGLVDYDGTIAKTPERQFKWFNFWADINNKKIGLNFTDFKKLYNQILDEKGVQAFYDYFGLPCDMNDFSHPVWNAYEHFKSQNPVEFYEGINDAISKVWEMGRLGSDVNNNQALRLAINTTNSWKSIYPELVSHGLKSYFESFCTAETLKAFDGSGNHNAIMKPSKISIALMLNVLGTKGESTFHLDDTIAGLKASVGVRRFGGLQSENLITIGAGWGFEGADKLNQGFSDDKGTHHYNHVIEHPSQLPDIIKQYI